MTHPPSGRGPDPRRRASGTGSRGAGRRLPGAGSVPRGDGRPAAGPRRGAARPRGPVGGAATARPRFTGRAAVLVLVLALLLVSYASSMRAYVQQRHQISTLGASIASSQAEVDRLVSEKKRWQDPTFVRTVAHQRFGWVLPGQIGFDVLDSSGKPMDHTDTLAEPASVAAARTPVWWQSAWGSVVSAGKRPTTEPAKPSPVRKIAVPKQPKP